MTSALVGSPTRPRNDATLLVVRNTSESLTFVLTGASQQRRFDRQRRGDVRLVVRPRSQALVSGLLPMESDDGPTVSWIHVCLEGSEHDEEVGRLFAVVQDAAGGDIKVLACEGGAGPALLQDGLTRIEGLPPYRQAVTCMILPERSSEPPLAHVAIRVQEWARSGDIWGETVSTPSTPSSPSPGKEILLELNP